ncbi:MAG: alpha/beta hydrolase [Cellvibrio sp.]|jgi:lysophospholipase|nr:alpha/beta hydrolase [Cellvibrio sp.]
MNDSTAGLPRFDAAESKLLQAQLPAIAFDPALDATWVANERVQAYLDYYGINFSRIIPGVSHGFGAVETDGFRIATHYWLPVNPKGTLVVMHGYYDHVGIFGHAIAFGLAQGLAVLTFDLPGHGLSSGEQVAINSFDQYADVLDVILIAAQRLLPMPYYSLGQSTGGAVLLNYLWRYDAARASPLLERIALCAPLVLPRSWNSGRFLYALVRRFIKRMPRGRSRNSHNLEFLRFVDEQDCLQSQTLSVRWVGAMKAWDKQFRAFPALDKPVLVIQGTEDLTVAWRYNVRQIRRALPKAQVVLIQGAGHQLVNEIESMRAQVFTEISRHFLSD